MNTNEVEESVLINEYPKYHFCVFEGTVYSCDFFENGDGELLWTSQLNGHHTDGKYTQILTPRENIKPYWEKWYSPYDEKTDGCWTNFHGKPNIF